VSDTRQLNVLCAAPCRRAVCPEILEVSEGTESENVVVAAFRQGGTLRDCRLPP
jgi:hypothetical protein